MKKKAVVLPLLSLLLLSGCSSGSSSANYGGSSARLSAANYSNYLTVSAGVSGYGTKTSVGNYGSAKISITCLGLSGYTFTDCSITVEATVHCTASASAKSPGTFSEDFTISLSSAGAASKSYVHRFSGNAAASSFRGVFKVTSASGTVA